MTASHPHWLRSALLAAVGLVIAIGSIVWVGLYIRSVGPETLSLSYRIDATRTLAFVRTADREKLNTAIKAVHGIFGEKNVPDLTKLPEGLSYEYALLSAESTGLRTWILNVHQRNQEETMLTQRNDASVLLPLTRVTMSLGALPFFRTHEKTNDGSDIFIHLDGVPALTASGSGLLGAVLSPFSSAFLLESKVGNTLILQKKERSLFTVNAPLLPLPQTGTPLFALSVARPPALLLSLSGILEKQSPLLLEGLRGILQKQLLLSTQSTDLVQAAHDLLGAGGTVSLSMNAAGSSSVLMEGRAVSTAALQVWLERVLSSTAPALIRTQTFLKGNSRTDVIAAPSENTIRTQNGWTILPSGSGSTHERVIGIKGRTVLLSNNAHVLEAGMDRIDHPLASKADEGSGLFAGTADTAWLQKYVSGSVLMTEEEKRLMASMIGAMTGRRSWLTLDGRDAVTVRIW